MAIEVVCRVSHKLSCRLSSILISLFKLANTFSIGFKAGEYDGKSKILKNYLDDCVDILVRLNL